MAQNVAIEPDLALDPGSVRKLIPTLAGRGYQVVAPVVQDGAIALDTIDQTADLPAGWTDSQSPGRYRLEPREDGALFGYNAGPRGLKHFLHPAEVLLYEIDKNNGLHIKAIKREPPGFAFIGVRACDLAALAIQDRVLLGDRYLDDVYYQQRQGNFIVAVQCTKAGDACFCDSLGTGPRIREGYDILLTEVVEPDLHMFLAKAGSPVGKEVLEALGPVPASPELCRRADAAVLRAERQKRRIDTKDLGETLYAAFDSARWDEAAANCLACGNCTQVCPTCFCTSVEDTSDISQASAQRWRRWDSCFTESFSYIHGGSIRLSCKSRYRQRLLHKFAAWKEQFGALGCTGCGRCTTWCPAGIDVVEEIAAVRETRPAATRVEEAANGHSSGSDTGPATPPIC